MYTFENDQEEEYYFQESGKGNTSARYRPMNTQPQHVIEDYQTVEPVTVRRASQTITKTGEQVIRQVIQSGRPRPDTRDDKQIPRMRDALHLMQQRQAPPQQPKKKTKPISRRALLGYIGAGVFAGVMIGSWLVPASVQYVNKLEEGKYASAVPVSIVCGHHDSPASPTELHAFVNLNGRISFIEYPGGDESKAHLFQTPDVRTLGYTGGLDSIYLQILPQQVNGKYQIELFMRAGNVGLFQSPLQTEWLLTDSGKGYFVGVNSAKV